MGARAALPRLFAAIPPEPPARGALASLRDAWLAALQRSEPAHGLRRVPEAALHLTLRYFGATPRERMAPLLDAMAACASAARPATPILQRVECWPARAPRVVVAVFDAPPALQALAAALEHAARGLGFPPEPRRFCPHVTLARGRPRALPPVALPVPTLSLAGGELVLFESRDSGNGPTYLPLAAFPLLP